MKIDLHMHSTISDGTDTPAQLLEKIRKAKIDIFALTDHDDCLGCEMLEPMLEADDPRMITGVEISAEEGENHYHILGYNYNLQSSAIGELTRHVHDIRVEKLLFRIDHLKHTYGFSFEEEDLDRLMRLPNPGKPHIGNLMVKYGYAPSMPEAIRQYMDAPTGKFKDITPEEAISAILASDGIPVLAHGIYGDGRQHLSDAAFEERVIYLKKLGLYGLECFYSRYGSHEEGLMLGLCEKYDLAATAGSDYHGTNKPVALGETHLPDASAYPAIQRFLDFCESEKKQRQ